MEQPRHIAFVPSPGMGRLIPLGEFAKRLVTQQNLSATFIIPNGGPLPKSQYAFLDSLPKAINYLLLPAITFDDLPQDAKIETKISLMVIRSIPSLHEIFKFMVADRKIVALFADLFTTHAFDVAIEFGVPPYLFFPGSAMRLSLALHMPQIDQAASGQFRDLPDPIQIPGCMPIHGRDLPESFQDRNTDAYKRVLDNAKRYMMARGIVVNSFKGLEDGAIQALQQDQPGKPSVYLVGPLIQTESAVSSSKNVNEVNCLRWLDGQPIRSVLYICFGSGGTLSSDQIIELAMGLELSGQRFLWVVRTPNDKVAHGAYLNASHNYTLDFLPKGFLERTKNRGLVVSSWAPQAHILSHGSTGGFLTHCGWNSILETIVHGVPMIVWPLYAEQKMNALMLADGLRVALRARSNENDFVDRLEIGRVGKRLFEGEEGKGIQIRIRELNEVAANELSKDGCSYKTLDELAFTLQN